MKSLQIQNIFMVVMMLFSAEAFGQAYMQNYLANKKSGSGSTVTNTASSTNANKCLQRLNGKNGCYQTTASGGCDVGFEYCSAANCSRNGGVMSNGTCADPNAKAETAKTPKTIKESPSTLRALPVSKNVEALNVPQGCLYSLDEILANPKVAGTSVACCKKIEGQLSSTGACEGSIIARKAAGAAKAETSSPREPSRPTGATSKEFAEAQAQSEKCFAAAKKAESSCSAEKNAKYQNIKNQSSQMANQMQMMGQQAAMQGTTGATNPWANIANSMRVVNVGLEAVHLECDGAARTCKNTCDQAARAVKEQGNAYVQNLTVEDSDKNGNESSMFQAKQGEVMDNSEKCDEYESAAAGIAQSLLEAIAARNQANVNAACTGSAANSTTCAFCTANPSSCPGAGSTAPGLGDLNASSCISNPTGEGCPIAQGKLVRDGFNTNAGGVDGGRFGSGGSGSGTSAGAFNWGDDASGKMTGSSNKPYELAPPNVAGGGGGGRGGGVGGGGGGGDSGAGGEAGSGYGDSLFDGSKAIGGSDQKTGLAGGGLSGGGSRQPSGKLGGLGDARKDGLGLDPNLLREKLGLGRGGVMGVAGAVGPDGLRGSDTVIWKNVNNAVLNDQIYSNPINVDATPAAGAAKAKGTSAP